MLALWSHEDGASENGVPIVALHEVLGPDRSNRRRTIRTLKERGLVEAVVGSEGARRIRLTSDGAFALGIRAICINVPLTVADMPSRPLSLRDLYVPPDEDEPAP